MALYDNLTGLPNRNAFDITIEDDKEEFGYIGIVDIDHFKKFNDTYGHSSGDAVLRQVANLLRRRMRETDFLCRYGGEEFAMIMLQTGLQEAAVIGEEIRKSVEAEKFYLPIESFQPVCARLTVSIGLAGLMGNAQAENELIEQADAALYRAKNMGRNCVAQVKQS